MTIKEITIELKKLPNKGLELTKRKGILTSTWCIYEKDSHYFVFDINEEFVFDSNHKYIFEELISEFQDTHFEIESIID